MLLPPPAAKLRARLPWALALVAGVVGTGRYHLAMVTSRFDRFFGDRGDGRFITYICEHWYQALTGRGSLRSPGFFHPVEGTLGFSDALAGYALPYSLLRALGIEMFSALQVVIVLLNFLSFVTCFALLHRTLRLNALASCAGALFFAFSSPKLAQIGHLQMQFTVLLPLLFALPIQFARGAGDGRRTGGITLAALAAVLHLQLLTTYYYGWFFVFWSLLFLAVSLLFTGTRRLLVDRARSSWRAIAGGGAVFAAGSLPFLALHLPALRATSAYTYTGIVPMIPAARNFLDLGPGNGMWGRLSAAMQASPPPPYHDELHVGIGLLPTLAWIGLTMFAIGAALRRSGSGAAVGGAGTKPPAVGQPRPLFLIPTILATSLFLVLAMKYGDGASPWRYVHALVPGGAAVRAVARSVIFLTLPMAVAFAWAIDRGLRWAAARPRRLAALWAQTAIAGLAFGGVYEQLGFSAGFSKALERVYLEDLRAGLPADCDAFYLAAPPVATRTAVAEHQYDAMMVSILTGVPTLNGMSSQFPPGWGLLATDLGAYEDRVREWIALERIEGKVCRLGNVARVEVIETTLPSAIAEPRFFVRQHYLDLLDREPTVEQLERWAGTIERCPRRDPSCDHLHVAEALFRSQEFLGRGDFLFRIYQVSLGRPPNHREFRADLARLGALVESTASEAGAQLAFAGEWVEGGGASEPAEVGAGAGERAASLVTLAAGEMPDGFEARTVVTLHYFAYLRRDPRAGVASRLERFSADGDTRALAAGFLRSREYRARVSR